MPQQRKRRHLRLIDPADGAEILPDRRVYTHAELTRWKVALETDTPTHAEYTASFRADEEGGVVFTLALPGTNLYPLQVRLFPNNAVAYESHIPLVMQVQPPLAGSGVRLCAALNRATARGAGHARPVAGGSGAWIPAQQRRCCF